MTIQVAIRCQEHIVLASDTLITDPHGTKIHENKIAIVKFVCDEVLVGMAGVTALTKRAVALMQIKAKDLTITEPLVVARVAEESMRQAKDNLNDEERAQLPQQCAELLIVFYFEGKPQIYAIDDYIVTAEERRSNFATSGCGTTLASYLLTEYLRENPDLDQAVLTAIYVIKKVKDHNIYCGGETEVTWVTPMTNVAGFEHLSKAKKLGADSVSFTERKMIEMDEKTKAERVQKVSDFIDELSRFYREKRSES